MKRFTIWRTAAPLGVAAMLLAVHANAGETVPRGEPDAAASGRVAAPAIAPASSASLEGIWMFDPTHSDDPMKVMQASRPQGGGERGGGMPGGGMGGGMGGGGWGGGRHGGGFGRGGGGAPGGESGEGPTDTSDPEGRAQAQQRQAGAQAMGRIMRPAKKVVIAMLGDEVTVAEDEREARPYALKDSLDAHQHDLVTDNTSAQWKSGRLEMTQVLGPRGKLVEAYELSKDGRTLTIRAHRDGGPQGMPSPTLTRVYTRYEGD